jgi:hypothetical protein
MAMDDNEAIKVIQKESPDLIVMNTGLRERGFRLAPMPARMVTDSGDYNQCQ